jgi:hypothetical protein
VDEEQMAVIMIHIGIFTRIDWVELSPPKENFHSAYVYFDYGDRNAIISSNNVQTKIWYSVVCSETQSSYVCDYWVDIHMAPVASPPCGVLPSAKKHVDDRFRDRVHDLEETVIELQRKFRELREVRTHIPSTPPRVERQVAQTFHIIPTATMLIDNNDTDAMSIATQSTYDSMPSLV